MTRESESERRIKYFIFGFMSGVLFVSLIMLLKSLNI